MGQDETAGLDVVLAASRLRGRVKVSIAQENGQGLARGIERRMYLGTSGIAAKGHRD